MRSILRTYPKPLAALACLIVWLTGFTTWAVWYATPPLDTPILLSQAGVVDREVRMRAEGPQVLALDFAVGSIPWTHAMELVGAYSPFDKLGQRMRFSGVNVPLEWSIADISGAVVASGYGDSFGRDSYGADTITRYVSLPFTLAPGRYRLRARILADVPELDGMTAHLVIRSPIAKAFRGWRDDLLFFGSMANRFVIAPFSAMLAVFLLGIGLRRWIGRP